jgi:hypothetical protein
VDRLSVLVHARSCSHVHVGDVRQQQLKALVTGGSDTGVEDCEAIFGVAESGRRSFAQSTRLFRTASISGEWP